MSRIESRVRDALAVEADLWPKPGVAGYVRRPSRRRRWIAIAVAVLAIGSIAATYLLTRDVTEPTAVAYFSEPHPNSDVSAATLSGDFDASRCESEWVDGPLVNEDIVPKGQVPPLVACVSDVGNLWVFPTDDEGICDQLGLATPNPDSMSEGNEIRRLTEDLIDHFDEHECQPPPVAEVDVREILDERGFPDWEIKVGSPRPDRPCASLGVDSENKTIHLVTIPRL